MRPFVENFPFFSIFLAILAGIVSAVIRRGRVCYWMTVAVAGIIAVLSAVVLQYTYGGRSQLYIQHGPLCGSLWKRDPVRTAAGAAGHGVFRGAGAGAGRRASGIFSTMSCRASCGCTSPW